MNTRTSRKVLSCLPPQKPLAAMSSLAPSVVIADRPDSTSLDTSCRSGSTWTSWHTSVSRFAVMSLISLCRMEGNPPRGQESTCSTVKLAPHSQLEGVRGGAHPYLKARASTKAPLCKTKPCSSKGREVSQLEENGVYPLWYT